MDLFKYLLIVAMFGFLTACANTKPAPTVDEGQGMQSPLPGMQSSGQMQPTGSQRAARAAAQTY